MFRFSLFLMSTLLLWALGAYAGPNQPPPTDQFGDALPDGAIARLGTVRFRHDSTIVFAAFLPNGKGVIPGEKRVLSVGRDGVASIWEFPSGKSISRLETLPGLPAEAVTSATLSPNGKRLTTFGSDGFMRVWDLEAAKELGKVPMVTDGPAATDIYGPGGGFSGKGGGKAANSREAPVAKRSVYSHDAKTLMAGSSRVLQFVNLETGKEVGPSHGHTLGLTSIWFISDGKITTKDIQSTRTWTSAGKELASTTFKLPATALTGTSISPLLRANTVVFSPDGRYVATLLAKKGGGKLKREAVVYDTADGKEVCRIALEVDGMGFGRIYGRPLVFSPDSKLLAINVDEPNNAKEKIQLYDVPSGKLLRTLEAGPTIAQVGPISTLYTQKMLFSVDSKALAFQAGRGAAIVVIDVLTGRQTASIAALEPTQVLMGAFSPDRRCLALEKGDGTVTICELATGKARLTYGQPLGKAFASDLFDDFVPASLPVAAIKSRANPAISSDGKLLAVCGMGGTIHIWDVIRGQELKVFKGHSRIVNALAFAPNSKTLASASGDTTALIWDVTKISRPTLPAKALKPGDLKAWWQALAGNDAAKAFAAMGDFEAVPQDTVAWIEDHLKPAAPLDMKRFEDLRKKLNDGSFKIRDAAMQELLKFGEGIVPAIDKAVAANPPLEAQRRLLSLRTQLMSLVWPAEKLQAWRAVEVLEHIATPKARDVLQALAEGATNAPLTGAAQSAIGRWKD